MVNIIVSDKKKFKNLGGRLVQFDKFFNDEVDKNENIAQNNWFN